MNNSNLSFPQFFEEFLEKIKKKDSTVITETLDEKIPLRILLPFGGPITDHKTFIEGQKKYFESPDTDFNYEIIMTEESDNLGFGVCMTTVKIPEVNSFKEFKNQICFLFKKHRGRWILTFDQNTRIGE